MSFRFTPLHRELGISPCELTWELIEMTVAQRVREQTDLDWKRCAYGLGTTDADELAKDVAAMANSGGGFLVLGILEDAKTSAALRVFENGVRLGDTEQRSCRQRIASATRPAITGVGFCVLESPDGQQAVTLVEVPNSLDAPHLLTARPESFQAPFRDGSQTQWMQERQLESAYRRRLDGRGSPLTRCEELSREAAENFHITTRACFIAAAAPEFVRARALGRPSRQDVVDLFTEAKGISSKTMGGAGRLSPFNDVSISNDTFLNPRPGHERTVARQDQQGNSFKNRSLMLAVHDDGCLSMAWSISGMLSTQVGAPNETSGRFVETAVVDFVAIVASAARRLEVSGGFSLQVGMVYDGDEPIVLRRADHGFDTDMDAAYSIPVRRFLPARQYLPVEHDQSAVREVASQLALDCVSQCGVWSLRYL